MMEFSLEGADAGLSGKAAVGFRQRFRERVFQIRVRLRPSTARMSFSHGQLRPRPSCGSLDRGGDTQQNGVLSAPSYQWRP